MNSRLKKNLIIFLLIGLYIIVGFFREFIFHNINEQSRVTYGIVYRHQPTESFVSPSMSWLSGLSYYTLYYSKWVLTLASTLLFAFLATRIIKKAFTDQSLIKLTWIAFAIVFLAGLCFYLLGTIIHEHGTTYDIARFLAGLTETPALLVILVASFLAIGRK